MTGNVNRIPQALIGKDHLELTKLMLINNVSAGKEYTYQIVHADKLWYAWYYEDTTRSLLKMRS